MPTMQRPTHGLVRFQRARISRAPQYGEYGSLTEKGYYKDGGGWAWYYDAKADTLEAVAAPKGTSSSQTYSASSPGFFTMKTNIARYGASPVSKREAVENAEAAGGAEIKKGILSGSGASGAGDSTPLTQRVWFWPVVILVPTAAVVGGILLLPTGPKPAPAA